MAKILITKTYEKRLLDELNRISKSKVRIIDRSNTSRGALFLIKGSEVALLRLVNGYRNSKNVEYTPKNKYLRFYVPSFNF